MKTVILFLIPLALLGGVIALFILTGGAGLDDKPAAPVESIDFERIQLHEGSITLTIRNTGQEPVNIGYIAIRDLVAEYTVRPSGGIPRMGAATVTLAYPWVEGEAYEILLFTANAIPFTTSIEAATETLPISLSTLLGFTLIGLYVGVLPVFLGIFWLPALRRLGPKAFTWLMALTIGLLIFLGIDAIAEALEKAGELGSPFQGPGLIGIGAISAFMLLDALSKRRAMANCDEVSTNERIALRISMGIGLHNLGEGLAIGSAFMLGEANLGMFFVIGFILQNITEGLGIIAPLVKQKPSLKYLGLLGLLGGGPAIVGTWLGGLVTLPALSVVFLALGAGAVLEVAFEIGKFIAKKSSTLPLTICSGVIFGMGLLYLTGFLIK
ncbi:MAG: hypothetical protein A2087_14545 [Spirochaetes bacterium GWD1_61_31]|nr:MAG: hypothetical protein A2Y37_10995 [Spirochaetes bacterium GWB1_60_80]OHD33703.1 MAG: hypothetical protein A2004_09695 [Spirochaetes bacterium GWC1_61_12]OHD37305.1 MAG: hypothetical protein A2087_14545 [Spirochaetes bacterium GWD1_61_31]OHD44964.1 MAG: hypothetical protein A2Y35_13040 [Spirochaetes bacterium GWE1_60_18]OHD60073.1 MAG: hypothetical protein A2Y32_11150 [Spirochaetes bacterium GWF1_60_12]HAP43636.1 metal transporter [Spirochaetaceae bacterium]